MDLWIKTRWKIPLVKKELKFTWTELEGNAWTVELAAGIFLTRPAAGEYIFAGGTGVAFFAGEAPSKMSVTSWISGPEDTTEELSDWFDGAGCNKNYS